MKYFSKLVLIFCFAISVSFKAENRKLRILVFTKTQGFRHASIEAGVIAIMKLGSENNFDVDSSSEATSIRTKNLKNYTAVIFLSTTGKLLDSIEKQDFEAFIKKGGGWVGVHAATDAEYNWPWYGKMAGGYFSGHPKIQEATIVVVDKLDISTRQLPKYWKRTDEWYNFKELNPDIHVLLRIDEKTYQGGTNGENHPMAWYHNYDGGRAWYTELGHTNESFSDPLYLKHLLGGIKYAMGIRAGK